MTGAQIGGHQASCQEILRRTGWLSEVPEAFRERVLRRAFLRRYEAGETIFSVGDPAGGIFGVVSGAVEVQIAPEHQGPYAIHFAGPGFWIGEAPLFTQGPRLVTLNTTRPTEVLHVPIAEINRMLSEDPENWRWLGTMALAHVKILLSIVDDMMHRSVERRCAAVLLRLAGLRSVFDYKDPQAPIDVSQEVLASMVNVSRNTLGIVLRSFQSDGLIDIRYKSVIVLNPSELEKMVMD